MRPSRSFLLALLLCPLLAAGCGGTAPRPDASNGAGGPGGEGGGGDETGGSGGEGGGQGGSGGNAGRGGSGSGSQGGSGGGSAGSGMGGMGTGGGPGGSSGGAAADGPSNVKLDSGGTDAPAGTDRPPDNPPPADTALPADTVPADIAPAPDLPPVAAVCGNVNCQRLWQLVESCRPMGACTQQSSGTLVSRCYANQVKVRARVMAISNTIATTFVKTDGTNCYLMDTPLLGGGGVQTLVIKELSGTEVARVTITESTAVSCMGGPQQTLNDNNCLPPFSLNECSPGECQ